MLVPVDRHSVWHERVKPDDLAATVPDHLRIGIAPEEQVRHERFPEDEGCHFRIRLIMEQEIQWMIQRFFLAAFLVVLVQMKRQTGDCL